MTDIPRYFFGGIVTNFKMMTDSSSLILKQPIKLLELSPEFKEMALVNGFNTLYQMTKHEITELQDLALFDHRMLAEYISFLTKHGLDDLIED